MAAELMSKFYKGRGPWTSDEDPWIVVTDTAGYAYQLNRETGETAEVVAPVELPVDEHGEPIYQL
jgi:hypothetical protein